MVSAPVRKVARPDKNQWKGKLTHTHTHIDTYTLMPAVCTDLVFAFESTAAAGVLQCSYSTHGQTEQFVVFILLLSCLVASVERYI